MPEEGGRHSLLPLRRGSNINSSATYRSVVRLLSLVAFDPPQLASAPRAHRTATDAHQEGGKRDLQIGSGPNFSEADPNESTEINPLTANKLLFAEEGPEFESTEDELGLLELQKELRDCIQVDEPKDAGKEHEDDREADVRVTQEGRLTDRDASTSGSRIAGARQGEGSSDESGKFAYKESELAGSRVEGAAEEQMPSPLENRTENGSRIGDYIGKDTDMETDGCMVVQDESIFNSKTEGAGPQCNFSSVNGKAARVLHQGLINSDEHENLIIYHTSLGKSVSKQLDEAHDDQKAAILGAQGGTASHEEACSETQPDSLTLSNTDVIQIGTGNVGEREDTSNCIEQLGSKGSTEVNVNDSLDVGKDGDIEEGEIMNEFGGSVVSVTGNESLDVEMDKIVEETTFSYSQKLPISLSARGVSMADHRNVERPATRVCESKLLDYCDLDLLKEGPVDNIDKRGSVGAKLKRKYHKEDLKEIFDKPLDPSERKRSKSKDVEVLDKTKRVMTEERKAKKKLAKKRKRAETNKKLGIKRLKIKPVSMPKKVVHCNFYLNGRCQQGASCKFSHDLVPLTKSQPCKYFACNSCLKGDDCPFDHELGKYSCHNFTSKGFCSRGDSCKFSHKLAAKEDSEAIGKQNTSSLTERIGSSKHLETNASSQGTVKGVTARAVAEIPSPVNMPGVAEKRTSLKAPKGIRFLSFDENMTGDAHQPQNALQNKVGSSVLPRSSKSSAMSVQICSPSSNPGGSVDRNARATKSTQKAFSTGDGKSPYQGSLLDRSAEKVQGDIFRKPPLASSATASAQSTISEEASRLLDEFLFHGTT